MTSTREASARGTRDGRMDHTGPRLHVRPPTGWLNDPNGLCRVDGTYHVFYQHNPDWPVHGDIHWGHARSDDLLHWTDEPIALVPQAGGLDRNGCWSGCIVDDGGVPTAVYTAIGDTAQDAQVALARSDRTLRAWHQDPVGKIGPPGDPSISEVRDPFVFSFDGRRYAVQGAGHRFGAPQLLLYGCDDLDAWSALGPLLTVDDPVAAAIAPANIWECPNVFRVGERWVVLLSLWRHRRSDRPDQERDHELAGVRYLVGDLVPGPAGGLQFVAAAGGLVDTGPDFYAPQVLLEPDRTLLWGWGWEGSQRSADQIADAGWAGVLTFPRELSLHGDLLVSRPAAELVGLRGAELVAREPIRDSAFEVISDGPVELALVDPATGLRRIAASTTEPGRILVDASIVEAFGSGPSATSRHYPTATSHWEVSTPAGCRIWRLEAVTRTAG